MARRMEVVEQELAAAQTRLAEVKREDRNVGQALERAREDQVLFFTCQRREGAYLAQKPGVTRAAGQSPSA